MRGNILGGVMDLRLGVKVRFIDPENPAAVIDAQFATIRGHGEMRKYLEDCARAEVAETIAIRRFAIASEELAEASDEAEIEKASEAINAANEKRIEAGDSLIEAVHKFIVNGFELAGSTHENAEALAMLVGPEQLAELRLKCAFGAGVVDFTRPAAQ